MNRADFDNKVYETACAILTELDAREDIEEERDFHIFYDRAEYDGSVTSYIDSSFPWTDWHDALRMLAVMDNDEMNDITSDAGLYEGVQGSKLFVTLAYMGFEQCVRVKLEELYSASSANNLAYAELVTEYISNDIQIGYYPQIKTFSITKSHADVVCDSMVKISNGWWWLVFEGRVEETVGKRKILVHCRRIYRQLRRGRDGREVNDGRCVQDILRAAEDDGSARECTA